MKEENLILEKSYAFALDIDAIKRILTSIVRISSN
jgi:hypothetical protein